MSISAPPLRADVLRLAARHRGSKRGGALRRDRPAARGAAAARALRTRGRHSRLTHATAYYARRHHHAAANEAAFEMDDDVPQLARRRLRGPTSVLQPSSARLARRRVPASATFRVVVLRLKFNAPTLQTATERLSPGPDSRAHPRRLVSSMSQESIIQRTGGECPPAGTVRPSELADGACMGSAGYCRKPPPDALALRVRIVSYRSSTPCERLLARRATSSRWPRKFAP